VDDGGEGVLGVLYWVLTRGEGAAGDVQSAGELRVEQERPFHCAIRQTEDFRVSASEGKE
jgi:hypothetical protein